MQLLEGVVAECQVFEKIDKMFAGEKINPTEGRSVLHTALRREASETLMVDGKNVVEDVHTVLKQIEAFSAKMRSEVLYSGKKLKNIVAIGIGGSFLGPEFVYEALRYEPTCKAASAGYNLKFLANVDPTDFFRALEGIDVEESLFIIVSKTFTTAETMLNARTCKNHIKEAYKAKVTDEAQWDAIFGSHLCAVSTNLKSTAEFGIKDENVFGFWEWVGGRFSVSSAVGVLPLSLFYGYDNVAQFLAGCKAMDTHF
jgi:glucose-6-phosphate isomerase